jgi:hypothetical protein
MLCFMLSLYIDVKLHSQMVGTTFGTRGRLYCMKFSTNIYLTSKEVFNLCFVQLSPINTCSWGPSFHVVDCHKEMGV